MTCAYLGLQVLTATFSVSLALGEPLPESGLTTKASLPLGFSASQQVSPAPICLPVSLPLSGDLTGAPPSHGFKAGAHLSVSKIDVVHEKVQM